MEYDLFISHASEDKPTLVAPLADSLAKLGVKVWYDAFALKAGDSLSRSIDRGLASSRYGLVVLSKSFLQKPWPEYELRGLVGRELGQDKVILPVWYGIARADLLAFSPPLADKLALNASEMPLGDLALKVIEVVRPDIHDNLLRWSLWQRKVSQARRVKIKKSQLVSGPVRHKVLPKGAITRSRIIVQVLGRCGGVSLEQFIENLRRDAHPFRELEIWEEMTATYLDFVQNRQLSEGAQREVFDILLACSMGRMNERVLERLRHVTENDAYDLAQRYVDVIRRSEDTGSCEAEKPDVSQGTLSQDS
jgi:TIR domain